MDKTTVFLGAGSVQDDGEDIDLKRRRLIQSLAGAAVFSALPLSALARDIITQTYGAATIVQDRVSVDMPSLAENGNSVAFRVSVDSKMTDGDFIEEVKVFAPLNPEPLLATARFGPASGKVELRTRIRLANSQEILAVARSRSGLLYSGSKKTVITLAACVEPLL